MNPKPASSHWPKFSTKSSFESVQAALIESGTACKFEWNNVADVDKEHPVHKCNMHGRKPGINPVHKQHRCNCGSSKRVK